jgi:hypothetical protein
MKQKKLIKILIQKTIQLILNQIFKYFNKSLSTKIINHPTINNKKYPLLNLDNLKYLIFNIILNSPSDFY